MSDTNKTKPGRRRVVIAAISAVAIAAIILIVWARRAPSPEEAPRAARTIPVELVSASVMTFDETVRGVGTLRASASVHISPEIPGRVQSVDFEEGSRVEEGQVLFQLDDDKLRSQLTAMRAALRAAEVRADNARRNFERQSRLVEQRVVAEDEFDRAEAEFKSAMADVARMEAELALTEEQLRDATIRAPFSGLISDRQVDRGAFVSTGQTLASLYQVDPLEIVFSVPERFAGRVARGQPVAVTVSSFPEQPFAGVVDFISPALDETTRSLRIKAVLPNEEGRLSPGAFATGVVTIDRRKDRTVAPEEALVATREGYMVYVVRDGTAESRAIRTGLRREGLVEVLEGLEPGEHVVRAGHLRLSDGDQVEVVRPRENLQETGLIETNRK